jgi:hypothetical protein
MVNPPITLAGCAIFLIYGGLKYYIGLRGWQALFSCVPLLTSKVYWTKPMQLEEPTEQGVNLQLSGHTHSGQIFPIQFITRRIFEKDWGLLRKNDFQLIVSSGYGTWGPPVRLGNTPEVVDIMIKFAAH